MAAGILGLTGIPGFIFYFVSVAIQALFWEAKAGFEWKSYFLDRTLSVTHSIVGGLFTYILFWVFLYGMVHVYYRSSCNNFKFSLEFFKKKTSFLGILGLTGIPGFIFYFVSVAIQALFWEAKAGFEWKSYFLDRTLSVTHSIVGGLFTYILFWVFLYGMVHVY
ncbi:hypothetical protein NECAME_13285 [Necator americanus]|uniref:ER membrane protein complex subunit 6 n=1 Tax=Necator americanus TaxID=51031 RepID=W2SYK9_NECAM|nr:hypothetical protein NECAME_13285 [Necator americanus]ETN73996.1 hypothetical protein NECAME_13285 [Necator americanus]